MKATKQEADRLRNVLRFIISNLHDFHDPIPIQEMKIVDQYMLHCLASYYNTIAKSYDAIYFNKVCIETQNFVANNLSSFYFPVIKDRLYCDEKFSNSRQSAVSTLFWIGHILTKSLSPIMPIMAQEIANISPCLNIDLSESIDPTIISKWENLPLNECFNIVLEIRKTLNQCKVEKSDAVLLKNDDKLSIFTEKDLAEIFQVSYVEVRDNDAEQNYQIKPSQKQLCPRCRLYQANVGEELCERCETVINIESV